MAGQSPFFITGANATIKVDGISVAYATNVSCQVVVNHVSPRVLGRAEVEAHQPVSYDVAGSLSIIKYSQGLKSVYGSSAPISANDKGSGAGSFTEDSGVGGAISKSLNIPGTVGAKAGESFNPNNFFQSQQFDIEIFQKIDGSNSSPSRSSDRAPIFRFRDCRFTGLQFQIDKKSPIVLSMTFKARYYDDDTLVARGSGVGQEFS